MGVPEFAVVIVVLFCVFIYGMITLFCAVYREGDTTSLVSSDGFLNRIMTKFLSDIEKDKPIRFSSLQLQQATNNFSDLLGSGGFGAVYKGVFADGTPMAVKVLSGSSDRRIEEQFMAEVSTIGRIHHFNLVQLYGFCFERDMRALVYEFMANGSLDNHLFLEKTRLKREKLHEIAVGTAKAIAYLHEECRQRIIHYDIKPGNILLDSKFTPKVADFGLAKLCNREKTHRTLTRGRGTPGYAAPELWMPLPVTHKCDVYSYGMLLFEIVGRRRNLNVNAEEDPEWFPKRVWDKFESEEMGDLMAQYRIKEQHRPNVEKMVKVALWCVQHRPEARPSMSTVVKMLEGDLDIPPPLNPFPGFTGVSCSGLLASSTEKTSNGSQHTRGKEYTLMQPIQPEV